MFERHALIVACDTHDDGRLHALRAPTRDADELGRVLGDPEIGGFEVDLRFNEAEAQMRRAIARFFDGRKADDLLLLHVSCHGLKDESGNLYFAARDTEFDHLSSTAVSADFVRAEMERSRSRRIVLSLDCCYSGAFSRALIARGGETVEIGERLGGRGRAVLTASSAMEYAFEDGAPEANMEPTPSVFTSGSWARDTRGRSRSRRADLRRRAVRPHL